MTAHIFVAKLKTKSFRDEALTIYGHKCQPNKESEPISNLGIKGILMEKLQVHLHLRG